MVMVPSFTADGFQLTECDNDEYFLSRILETILVSVDGNERSLSPLWAPDIEFMLREQMRSERMFNERFVLKKGDENVGVLWMGKTRDQFTCETIGYLLGIFVEERYRSMGLGSALMDSAEEWCRENGLMHMSLNVSCLNDGARELYLKKGYRPQSTVMRKLLK